MTLSHVSLERNLCKVCFDEFNTNAILIDNLLRNSLERTTLTGWGLCPDCQKLHDDGYVAIIGVSNKGVKSQTMLTPNDANRTGDIAHLRRSVWEQILHTPIPVDEDGNPHVFVFADVEVISALKAMMGDAPDEVAQ